MTVYFVISLPKIPYLHHIYMVLANPTHKYTGSLRLSDSILHNDNDISMDEESNVRRS